MKRRLAHALALVLLVSAVVPFAAPTRAQDLPEPGDGFLWERVGDYPIDVFDLAFADDGALWGVGRRGFYRLDLSGGPPGAWDHVLDSGVYRGVLPLGRGPEGDTLVAVSGSNTRRSLDGGRTWEQAYNRGGGALFEIPAGLPHAGRLLVGADDGFARAIAYSDDRGATWTEAEVEDDGEGNYGSAVDIAVLPAGAAHAGRLLGAGRWGVNLSDDGGATWRKSGLWQAVHYDGECIGVTEGGRAMPPPA